MKIINKPNTVVNQDIPEPKEKVRALIDTFFKARPKHHTLTRTFYFFTGTDQVYLAMLGSTNRWTDEVHFQINEDVRPKLEALGWTEIELIKDKKLKMELVNV